MKKNTLSVIGYLALASAASFLLVALAGLFWRMAETAPQRDFSAHRAWFAVRLSLSSATFSTAIAMIFALPAGYVLSRRRFPGKNILEAALLLPMVISPVALGALLLIFFNTPPGRLVEKIIGPVVFESRGIVVAQFVVISGLAVTLVKTVFDYVSRDYEDTARSLGCGETETFLRVTLPMSARGLAATAILVWARALGEFGATVTLAGATTYKTETLPVAIYLALASADVYHTGVLIILSFAMAFAVLFLLKTAAAGRDSYSSH